MSEFRRHLARQSGIPAPAARERRPDAASRPQLLRDRSEADLCDVIGTWLRAERHEVFYEVPIGKGRPDVLSIKAGSITAVEAKLTDIDGVIKQGMRAAALIDIAYVALPISGASEAVLAIERIERRSIERGRRLSLPGVLAVGRGVTILRDPSPRPKRRRVSLERVRADAERYGQPRGGVPSGIDLERDAAIWDARRSGDAWLTIAEAHNIGPNAARNAVRRIEAWRGHLNHCDGNPCLEPDADRRDFIAGAHRHATRLWALIPPADPTGGSATGA